MSQLTVAMLALFGKMDLDYTVEPAAHARSVAPNVGECVPDPALLTPQNLVQAERLQNEGHAFNQIAEQAFIRL